LRISGFISKISNPQILKSSDPQITLSLTLADLRRFAVARSLFPPTTLARALDTLGFVQADPIRAPARAQDLTLRHRVAEYRAGDLERLYHTLGIEEDIFINYGFVTREVSRLMHPRSLTRRGGKREQAILDFVRTRGTVHPREVDAQFAHGRVTNYWGGSSNASTFLLERMHYRGLIRVVRRDAGIRVYEARPTSAPAADKAEREARLNALVDVAVRKYAPVPAPSLAMLIARLRYAAPQWKSGLKQALRRARARLAHQNIDGVDWYWPADEVIPPSAADDVFLLAPFDPVVWDRRRFELLWGWAYRFEAYTPAAKRKLGYYALPLLWRDRVIGWGNVSIVKGAVRASFGYVGRRPRDQQFARALDEELERLKVFLDMRA
jgi:uncharacterized protein YcaQ